MTMQFQAVFISNFSTDMKEKTTTTTKNGLMGTLGVVISLGLINPTVTTVFSRPKLVNIFVGAQGFGVTTELLIKRFS